MPSKPMVDPSYYEFPNELPLPGEASLDFFLDTLVYLTLKHFGWNKTKTYRSLRIGDSTLRRYVARMKSQGYDIPVYKRTSKAKAVKAKPCK